MSLYYEAANFLNSNPDGTNSSTIYSAAKTLKSKPAQIIALISETTKWSGPLSAVVENADILQLERKLTPSLALLLIHDLLISKTGLAAPKDHVLRLAIERHKARLSAELTKARIKAGHATLDTWRDALETHAPNATPLDQPSTPRHPRWIRINTIKTTLEAELSTTFSTMTQTSLSTILHPPTDTTPNHFALDAHIPSLIGIPSSLTQTFTTHPSYRKGNLIFQDKASCFPAYLLNPQPTDGNIIDACAAPGNKTTHLAALLTSARSTTTPSAPQHIYACERNPARSQTLIKMLTTAGLSPTATNPAGVKVEPLPGQDFLRLDPFDPRFANVGAILLDPSCSGSGIIGRGDEGDDTDILPSVTLPRRANELQNNKTPPGSKSRKRKRPLPATATTASSSLAHTRGLIASCTTTTPPVTSTPPPTTQKDRLQALSNLQTHLLTHALSFPRVRKIIYSTCSIHEQENEVVALRALRSAVAVRRGWRVLRREEQVAGMREWGVRGVVVTEGDRAGENGDGEGGLEREVAEASLRCVKGGEEGTMGFFVVGFVRDGVRGDEAGEDGLVVGNGDGGIYVEEEFEGFSDNESDGG